MNEEEADRRAARLFRNHHGVIDRGRLLAAGITPRQMDRRLASGRWQQVHRGVYQLAGTPTTPQQELLAACLAAGPSAVASHGSAAWLWGMIRRAPDRPDVAVPPTSRPRLASVRVHRLNDLEGQPISYRRNIPTTGPLRTLVDLAAVAEPSLLADAVDHAMASGLVSAPALVAELQRRARSGRRGVRTLRGLLEDRGFLGGPPPSALEGEATALLRRFAIPVEGREVWTGPDGRYRVDIMVTSWLVVEVDGYAYHWSPEAKRNDEARRNELRLSGLIVLVYTWRDIRFDQARVAREIRAARALHP